MLLYVVQLSAIKRKVVRTELLPGKISEVMGDTIHSMF